MFKGEKKLRKQKKVLLSLLLGVGVMLSACNAEEASQTEETFETPVAVAKVYKGSLNGSNEMSGVVKADTDINIMPKSAGEITEILVSKGDLVEKGQVLAKLESKDQTIALQADQAAVRQAENGLTQAQNNLRQTQSRVTEAEQGHEFKLKNLQIELENAKRQLNTASKELERSEELYKEGLISLQQLESAQNAEKQLIDGVSKLELQISLEEDNFTLVKQQSGINLETAMSTIRDAELAVQQRKLALESAQKRIDDTTIKAPVAGKIAALDFVVGQMVSNQTPFARIISADKLIVELAISADRLPMFETDKKVGVSFLNVPNKREGTVTYIAPGADTTGLFTVEIGIENEDNAILPGMVGTVIVEEILVDNSLIVPTTAVIEHQGVASIFIVNDKTAVQKEVEVIRFDSEFTAIAGEINEGDQVVVKGQNLLSDGDPIRIVEEEK